MPKGRMYLILPHSFTVWKLWFLGLQSRDQASMLVNDFFFAEFFAEFVRKHTIKFLAELRDFCSCPPAWLPWRQLQTSGTTNISSSRKSFWDVPCKTRLPPLLRLNTRFGLRAWRLHITLNLVFPVVMWSYNMIYNYLLCTDKQFVCSGHLFYRENGENEEWFNKLHSWKPV